MAYILLSENCKGHQIKFIEENGVLLTKPTGRNYRGTLALQTFEDRDYMRITFADGANVWGGAINKFFSMAKAVYNGKPFAAYRAGNADYLCHFDFSKADLNTKKKKITYSIQFLGFLAICVLSCYDFKTHTGCCYMFPDHEEAKKWAKMIGVTEIEYLNSEGILTSKGPLT